MRFPAVSAAEVSAADRWPRHRRRSAQWRRSAAALFSLLAHAVLLSLTFGTDELGLPGLGLPWQQRRAEATDIRVVLAPPPPPAPAASAIPEPQDPAASEPAPAASMPEAFTVVDARPNVVLEPLAAAPTPPPTPAPTPAVTPSPISPAPEPPAPAPTPVPAPARTVLAAERAPDLRWSVPPSSSLSSSPVIASASSPELAPALDRAKIEAEMDKAAEQARLEAARLEAIRQEAARQEALRLEAARVEAARQEAARLEAAKQETARQELARQEAARQEAVRQEANKQETARLEAARQEAARVEAARQEAARVELAKQEVARQAAARQEAARQEAARQEAARQEALRQEAARREAARQEAARIEAARLASIKAEADAREARLRAIGQQLNEEAAKRDAAAAAARPSQGASLPYSISSPRRGRIFGRTDNSPELVLYAEAWSRKIQLNQTFEMVREAARQPHADPLVIVAVRSNGSIESITFVRSSGVPALDEAIKRVIQSQENYAEFSPLLAREYDVVEIRRTWHFDMAIRLY
ncbi:TonB C-terminal domain-containing protein [Pelomonas sp. SE-A7]|uniref:TonB C-terminal domain-containing protein n=1 Tax=Pelomonas sp. SE-A7 TaxID=3054953 RepID=UPI00259C7CF1|nr:TonB C-terminal domain-containing protein [Pelomonas sp. SE-A7]MDM4765190.1 TonB C-terminal domain-containing protein [Pelomonas sp. SE-A7]